MALDPKDPKNFDAFRSVALGIDDPTPAAPDREWMCQACGNLNGRGMTAIPWNCMRCGLSSTARAYPSFDMKSGAVVYGPFGAAPSSSSSRAPEPTICPTCGRKMTDCTADACWEIEYRKRSVAPAPDAGTTQCQCRDCGIALPPRCTDCLEAELSRLRSSLALCQAPEGTKIVHVTNELIPQLSADWSPAVQIRIASDKDGVLELHFRREYPTPHPSPEPA